MTQDIIILRNVRSQSLTAEVSRVPLLECGYAIDGMQISSVRQRVVQLRHTSEQ
jgi:hypothetical protein